MCLSSIPLPTKEQIADLRLAASIMTHKERRIFVAEMALKYCDGSPRKTESLFGWGREMVAMGLGEKRTGIHCIGAQSSFSGKQRWEDRHPDAAKVLCELAEAHAQQDLSFATEIAFTRLTAEEALKHLQKKGFREDELPANGTMAKILNRLGYRLRPVEKVKPKKKIPETDAIFDNIKKKEAENQGDGTKCISIDCKATVKLGEFSRGGLTRGNNKAQDHDMGDEGKHTPFGILDEDIGQVYIYFGSSFKTSDFIVDSLEQWWDSQSEDVHQETTLIQIKVDNGPENSGVRTQFLKRMVDFSERIGVPIQLLYYPPYHSKYNPIERCWGVLEMHWNGAILLDTETMLSWAKSMKWKGIHSIISLSETLYEKGISLTKKMMKAIESRLIRNKELPKWDIYVKPF